ncbi:MAG: ABC transporter permease [Thiomonas delicata]|jgi:peptide/nickel transport system permease protein
MSRLLMGLKRHKLLSLAVVAIVVVASVAIFAPLVAPYSPDIQFPNGLSDMGSPLPPNHTFPLGTDLLGRDLLSRMIYGARTSLIVGVVANFIAVLIGTTLGLVAGFARGVLGNAIMRFTDLMLAFPALILAIALAAILHPSLWIVILVIALVNWTWVCRVIYTQTTALIEREYIEAVRSLGASPLRIMVRHLIPHLVPTIIVWGTLGIATAVQLEATLSFLGVGVQPPTPSWGNIIFENQSYFSTAPWLVLTPGLAIIVLALAFNILGDALRELVDPTRKGRS